jgi:murein DD-endopeptidase MepM/ murein hydrolase activator NlpD
MMLSMENRRNIFRLSVILILAFFFLPNASKKEHEEAAQYGVGGATVPDMDIAESPESLESVVLEPESFSKSRILLYDTHVMKKGEIIGELARIYGLHDDTIISANKIRNTRLVQEGKVIKIPNQDGIFHTVKNGDTLNSVAEKYKSDPQAIQIANELFSDSIKAGMDLFIPGARLDWVYKQEINGDLFIWPVSGYITSPYGYRRSPFTGVRQLHTGLDIGGNKSGTPIRAAMSGRVTTVGYDRVLGNYVVISHHSGYRTLYGHMSVIRAKTGAYVGTGERIGDIGSTGLSTGPHLHFTVYKNGVTVNPRTLLK